MKKLLLSLIVICSFTSAALAQQDATVVEEIVARVNNSIITRADLRRNLEQTEQDQNLPKQQMEEREANSLRDLIDQQLLIQKAADLGISADADLVKRLDDLRKEMKASSMEELQKLAESQGVRWEEFKQNTKNGILTQKVIGTEVGSHLQITHEEIQKFYDEHKADFAQPERVRLSEIMVATNPNQSGGGAMAEATPEQVAAAEARANDVYQQLKAGAKFDELARKESTGSTAERGGDLGYFKRNDLAKELEDKSFVLKPGEYTQPIRTRQGYIILRVTDHIESGVPPLDRVREQIQEQLYSQKVQPALREYLTKLREEAYIDIKPGYTDTGASPNQTKLIYTSDSGPKTKQVRGKLGIGKKKTVVVVGKDKHDHSQPTGSTSELGRAKSEVDAQAKAENDRKAAADAAAAKAAADAAEKEKLSHMTPQEQKKYLAQKKREEKKQAKLDSKETKKQKQLAKKEAKRKALEAKNQKNGTKPAQAGTAANGAQTATSTGGQAATGTGEQAAADSAPPKKKKSISWF
jgi:peptidyl-prolyl cis-trans isomerase SurA